MQSKSRRSRLIVAAISATFASWDDARARRSWKIPSCPCPRNTRKSLCSGARNSRSESVFMRSRLPVPRCALESARVDRFIEQAVEILFVIAARAGNAFGVECFEELLAGQPVEMLRVVSEWVEMPDRPAVFRQ